VDKLRITRELIADLTVGELEELEERTSRPLSRLFDADAPRGVLLHTLAYIQLRREEPETTWEDAAGVRVDLELETDDEVVGTTADPTPAGRGRRRG
jgi:hypothetical protein